MILLGSAGTIADNGSCCKSQAGLARSRENERVGGQRTMTEYRGDFSPAFEIDEPKSWRAPILFNSPHSGSVYPNDFLNASRIDLDALQRSEDSFMDELIEGLVHHGFPVMRVHFPRSYIDVNREPYELDPRMFTGRKFHPSRH